MIESRSRKISRDKLNKLTGGDHETIKFLENTQVDASGAVGGANEAADAAAASAAAAAQAAQDASEARLTADQAISDAADAQDAADAAQSTSNSALALAQEIDVDYVSKTETADQAVASNLQAASYRVNGLQVVGARVPGWTTGTGTPSYAAFNANTAYTVGAAYSQTEILAISLGLVDARQRILALERTLRAHGLIN